jgi:isoleucyl-tRNA synthetase
MNQSANPTPEQAGTASPAGTENASQKPAAEKSQYRSTVNLPKTAFPMKANLVQNEPASQKRWEQAGIYKRLREERADSPRFVFHDGPPYANGSIHLGHVLNKSLKDFVVRSRTMMGMDVPYIPGWDCHGLPIEHRVVGDLVEKGKAAKLDELPVEARHMAIRKACAEYALKQVKLQSGQMQRLLTMADYQEPYLTLHPSFEGGVLDVLADLFEQGLVYRALKPVHWSIANETALADAELEYMDREDTSVFVDFESLDPAAVYNAFNIDEDAREEQNLGASPSFMIWTTTPWTLPANVGVALQPKATYALVRMDGTITVLAEELVTAVAKAGSAAEVEILATTPGERLIGLRYRHPFVTQMPACGLGHRCDEQKVWSLVAADYVTMEDGTGLVHTAPGHGQEDFQTGLREGLPVYCPVKGDGRYDMSVPEWIAGLSIWEANDIITNWLRNSGHLFHSNRFMHSYPHDWRSKTPVIFRCTEQWFVGVDRPTRHHGLSLRELALKEARERVTFVPAWGRSRLVGMLESRPDWCISRQRSWGVPVPAFFRQDGTVLATAAVVRAVAAIIREKGTDAWFQLSPAELLRDYDGSKDPQITGYAPDPATLRKGWDILDVWFESGTSWNGCPRTRTGDFPVEVYLEGSDQHRGWFQSSMLCALGMMGRAPYDSVVTHGFMVDKDGKKLSKSKGDTVEDLFQKYGADVIRWWVSSLAYDSDMKVDEEFYRLAGESYRKIRNTLRYLLSNLDGYDHATHATNPAVWEPTSLDAWILGQYEFLAERVVRGYERFAFREVHQALYDFCNDTLSSVYLAAVKDRLYCDALDSDRRRRTQSAMYLLTKGLCSLLAPMLPHTADEAYRVLVGATDQATTIHTQTFVRTTGVKADDRWAAVMQARDQGMLALERLRSQNQLDNPLDAGVQLADPQGELAAFDLVDLADLLGVSRVTLGQQTEVTVSDLRSEPRCERSWKRDGTVRERSDGGMLSDRDAAALGLA